MPNWTTNKMVIDDKDLRLIINRNGDVDFNLIRPMPKSLDIGNIDPIARSFAMRVHRGEDVSFPEKYPWLREHLDYMRRGYPVSISRPSLSDYDEFGALLCQNVERYGHADWYSWCSSEEGWGTKWNACETKFEDSGVPGSTLVVFLTAWSCPSASMVAELRAKCHHPLRLECVDEDGYGDVHDENGEPIALADSLFRAVYQDEGGNLLSEEEFAEAERNGKDVWRYLV